MKRVAAFLIAFICAAKGMVMSAGACDANSDLSYWLDSYETIFAEHTAEEEAILKSDIDMLKAQENEKELIEKYYEKYLQNASDDSLTSASSSRAVQLNSMMVNRLGALQDLAREYVNSLESDGTYDFNTSDEYNGMKDVWYCFYFLRYIAEFPNGDKRYDDPEWEACGSCDELASNLQVDDGEDGSFLDYVMEQDPSLYNVLDSMVNGSNYVYSAPSQKLDLGHLAASMTVYLYNLEDSVFADVVSDYDDLIHDNYSCWAGDLCTLINEAYDSTAYNGLYNSVYNMMGDSQYSFGTEDIYSDADAVNLRYILDAYRANNGTGNVDIESILSTYYGATDSHIEDFTDTIWYQKIYYYTRTENSVYKNMLNQSLTEAESTGATLGFIDYMEDTFNVSIEMYGYTG